MSKNEKIIEVTDSMDKPALYVFESGIYKLPEKHFKCDNGDIIIEGRYNNTIFKSDESITVDAGTIFKNLKFIYTKIIIKDNCRFENVTFDNCIVNMKSSQEVDIVSCNFINTGINFFDSSYNNIITNCRFKDCRLPRYYGGSNLFTNNLAY